MIILIGGEKGGTGKTTLTTNLAVKFAHEGKDILIVDTDKQGSASAWAASRDEKQHFPRIASVQKFGKHLPEQLKDLSTRYQSIIVDAGGRDSVELRSGLIAADILIIPIQASQFDVWTLGNMDELVKQTKLYNPKIKAYVVLNRASPNPAVHEIKEASEIICDLDEIKLLNTIVRDRISFRKAAKSGVSVIELEDKDIKAIAEINAIYNEIFGDN